MQQFWRVKQLLRAAGLQYRDQKGACVDRLSAKKAHKKDCSYGLGTLYRWPLIGKFAVYSFPRCI
jgi:hypothetical protein